MKVTAGGSITIDGIPRRVPSSYLWKLKIPGLVGKSCGYFWSIHAWSQAISYVLVLRLYMRFRCNCTCTCYCWLRPWGYRQFCCSELKTRLASRAVDSQLSEYKLSGGRKSGVNDWGGLPEYRPVRWGRRTAPVTAWLMGRHSTHAMLQKTCPTVRGVGLWPLQPTTHRCHRRLDLCCSHVGSIIRAGPFRVNIGWKNIPFDSVRIMDTTCENRISAQICLCVSYDKFMN